MSRSCWMAENHFVNNEKLFTSLCCASKVCGFSLFPTQSRWRQNTGKTDWPGSHLTADYTLNREGKIYVQKTKTNLESSPRLSRGKNTVIPSIERHFKACTFAREQLCVKYYILWGCRCGFVAAEKRPRFLTVTWEMIAWDLRLTKCCSTCSLEMDRNFDLQLKIIAPQCTQCCITSYTFCQLLAYLIHEVPSGKYRKSVVLKIPFSLKLFNI